MEKTEVRAKESGGSELAFLMNALQFEQEKNRILLEEVVELEDVLVNRQMAEFDAVISDDTREFWREQLLANREKAEGALTELVRLKTVDGGQGTEDGGRRPLHNRHRARPVRPADREAGHDGAAESKAVKIRNRAHELRKTEGIPFSTAFRRAEKEVRGVKRPGRDR